MLTRPVPTRINTLNDVPDVNTPTPTKNDVLKWNGTEWVDVPEGTSFTFAIASFTSNAGSSPQEIGAGVWKAIGALSFSATYSNGPCTNAYVSSSGWSNLTMTGAGYVGPTVSTEAKNYPASPGSISFTLNATDGVDPKTSVITINFYNRIFWGTSTKASGYNEADIEGLGTNAISNTKGRSFTESPADTYYIIYALPTRLGTVTFWVGGFEGGFESPETVSVTNASGFTENYYVYRSTNEGLGSTTVTVV